MMLMILTLSPFDFRFCVGDPSVKDENGKFVARESLPQILSDPESRNEYFDLKINQSSETTERRTPAAVTPEPAASSPLTESESSGIVAETEEESNLAYFLLHNMNDTRQFITI